MRARPQEQVACFRNAAAHLAPGGRFVIENYVPELRLLSSPHRYVWPAELDLMAQLAGLALEARWSDWHRALFTGESRSHVSVWTA